MEQLHQRWGFLAPWCDALKHRVSYQAGKFPESPVTKRSLCVSLPRRESMEEEEAGEDFSRFSDSDRELFFRNQFQKTREALALLAAVAHVEYAAWRYLLEKHCSVDLGVEGEPIYEEEIPIRYVINLDQGAQVIINTSQDREFYEYDIVFFCGVHQRLHPSEEYREALRRIAALGQNAQRTKSGFDFDVPVRVQFDPLDDYDDVTGLVEVAIAERIVKEQWGEFSRSAAVAPGEWRCTFVLERMIADLTPLTVPGEMGAAIKTLLRQNTWFSLISVYLTNIGMSSTQAFGQLMSSIFDSARRPSELANTSYHPSFSAGLPPLQVGEVKIIWNPDLEIREAGALCSAMAHTQLSKILSLRLWMKIHNRERSQQYWKWLAYALFSKRARVSSSVQSLALMKVCSMSTVDMEPFTSMLKSEHPEEDLFDSSPGCVKSRKATLSAGTLVRCVLDDRNGPTEIIAFDAQVPCVRTFSDDGRSTWVDCIVPGYGQCRVQRRDLMFGGSSSDDEQSSRGEGITSLRLHLDKEFPALFDGISRFFGAVGAPLRQLTLDAPRGDLSSILQCCPNLEELSLCGGVVDARLNFRDCHARGEPLPELNLNWDSVSAIATVLADNDNKLTKCARRIRVRVNNFQDEDGNLAELRAHERRTKAAFTALLSMLEQNKYLEYLELVVHPDYERYQPKFRRHHLQPIWCALSPLSLRSKLAFLSKWVVKPTMFAKRARTQSEAGATMLSPHVLRIIFEFAADPVLREVYLRKSDRIVTELIQGEESI